MFDSNFFDYFSRIHPIVPLFIFLPAIVVLFVLGLGSLAVLPAIGIFLLGWLFWTLFEYWMHRMVFHFQPENGFGARLHWIIHGVHHDHPNDPMRLVMPPSVSIPLASLMCLLFWAIAGAPYWYVFAAGFLLGYLIYDMAHYYVHHFRPRGFVGRKLRELHMRHHFQDPDTGYGVSAPWWDHVFGTATKKRGTKTSKS